MITTESSPLARTVDTLFTPGRGVLVLDRYAEAAARAARPAAVDPVGFARTALSTPGLDQVISGILLTLDGLLGSRDLRDGPTHGFAMTIGVCLDPSSTTDDVLARGAAAGAAVVELRANLGPGLVRPGEPATEADRLARGARRVQDAGLVPVLTFAMPDLATHTQNVSHAVTSNALRAVVMACDQHEVDPSALVIRASMVAAGARAPESSGADAVGRATAAVLRETLPGTLAGVLLLSGGISLADACDRLTATVAALTARGTSWRATFGFSRPLVDDAARHWDGTTGSPSTRHELVRACRVATEALTARDMA